MGLLVDSAPWTALENVTDCKLFVRLGAFLSFLLVMHCLPREKRPKD